MKYLLALILMIPCFANAQKILLDKTDPFTNVRTLTTNLLSLKAVALTPILRFVAMLDVKNDSLIDVKLMFTVPDVGVRLQLDSSADSSSYNCWIKTKTGKIYQGQYFLLANMSSSLSYANGLPAMIVYTYVFSIADAEAICTEECTDVKFIAPNGNQGLFEIDRSAQDKIGKACKLLLAKVRNHKT